MAQRLSIGSDRASTDKDGKQYGEVTYKPDDILLFHLHTWRARSTAGDAAFEFLGFDMMVL